MITQIYITEHDIKNARKFSSTENPICIAIRRTYWLWEVKVFTDKIIFNKRNKRQRSYKFSPDHKVYKFLMAFHSGENVKPFRIQLELPG